MSMLKSVLEVLQHLFRFSKKKIILLSLSALLITSLDLVSVYSVQLLFAPSSGLTSAPPPQFTYVFVFLLIVFYALRIYLLRLSFILASEVSSSLTTKVYSNYLHLNYETAVSISSSKLLALVTKQSTDVLGSVINPLFNVVSSLLSLAVISIFILFEFPLATYFIVAFFVLYLLLLYFLKLPLSLMNNLYPRLVENQYMTLSDTIHSIPLIFMNSSQSLFATRFNLTDKKIKRLAAILQFLTLAPRFLLEALLALSLVIGLSFNTLPISEIAVLSFALLRILPLVNSLFASFVSISANSKSFFEIFDFVNSSDLANPSLSKVYTYYSVDESITFASSSYAYPIHLNQLQQFSNYSVSSSPGDVSSCRSTFIRFPDISCSIGSLTSLIGPSGCGKSTFLELLVGLRDFHDGQFSIDNGKSTGSLTYFKLSKKNVFYMPQFTNIVTGSLLYNITYPSCPDSLSANELQLIENLMGLKLTDIYLTNLSPTSTELSGGQRQRLGFLRAMLSPAKFLIMDEPTSAQDSVNESKMLDILHKIKFNKLVFMTAHRQSAISSSDVVYSL